VTGGEALAYLADREAIRALVHACAAAIDRGDPDAVHACFTSDAAGDDVPEAGSTMHLVGNHLASIDGSTAAAETYVLRHHLGPAGSVQRVVGLRWLDELVRTDGGWRVRRRQVIVEFERARPVAS
jgi:SnoaL-like protein